MKLFLFVGGVAALFLAGCQTPHDSSPGSAKEFVQFALVSPSVTGTIDTSALSVQLNMPYGSSRTALIAHFVTTGVRVTVNGVVQTSDVSVNDFSHPVDYQVTAEDGTSQTYRVNAKLPSVMALGGKDYPGNEAGYWNDGVYTALGPGMAYAGAQVGSVLYVGGQSNGSAGYWKNGVWIDLAPAGATDSVVNGLATSGSDLYAAGTSTDSASVDHAMLWKNGVSQALALLDASRSSSASCVVVSGGDIYVGGTNSDSAGKHPGYWKNGAWTSLPVSAAGKGGSVSSLAVVGDTVYAGGTRDDATTALLVKPGYWKNSVWVDLPALSSTKNSVVNGLAVLSGGDLLAVGWSFGSVSGSLPGVWKNGVWQALANISDSASSGAQGLVVSGSDVFVGGYSKTAAGYEVGGYWQNGQWTALGSEATTNYVVNAVIMGY